MFVAHGMDDDTPLHRAWERDFQRLGHRPRYTKNGFEIYVPHSCYLKQSWCPCNMSAALTSQVTTMALIALVCAGLAYFL